MFSRRSLLGVLLGAILACAPAVHAQEPQTGLPVEPLQIITHDGKVHDFKVEVADNDQTRETGLMFRRSLAPDAGMLFDFKTSQNDVAFWMKNTLIPLDMLFIDQNGVIVNIKHEATPLSETPIPAGAPVLGVLEIAGGRADQLGVMVGDKVKERIFTGG